MYQVKFDWETSARAFEDKDNWKTTLIPNERGVYKPWRGNYKL